MNYWPTKFYKCFDQTPAQTLAFIPITMPPKMWNNRVKNKPSIIAEVVGKWVWIQFDGKQPVTITSVLSELGFHWNNTRQAWQHPCGTITDERADYDPRKRYGSYFAADRIAA
jgi:hypothetical protein